MDPQTKGGSAKGGIGSGCTVGGSPNNLLHDPHHLGYEVTISCKGDAKVLACCSAALTPVLQTLQPPQP